MVYFCLLYYLQVAIIIPYRKRYGQLKIFLRHMHPMLKRQLLDYRIMVIEQVGQCSNYVMLGWGCGV